jgi:glycosyltransferase involved in cell wall biosynthesis
MSRTPLVSFIVPCYNYARYLPDCLNSIFNQERSVDFEIIAIDDASSDDTVAVLDSYSDPRLQVVRHERNRGHIATVNEGFALARGTFIARIDPDDRYRSGFLAQTLPKFESHPEVGLVYGDAALINEAGDMTADRTDVVHGGRDSKSNELILLLETNCICAPTAIARREIWQRGLPIPEGLAFNDWYFNVTMARYCEFYYVNAVLADYRVHAQNHHVRIVRDKTEEPSILRVLSSVFDQVESDRNLERAKRKARPRIFASQYLTLANKYFWMEMNDDARRCYWTAVRHQPTRLLDFDVQRRLAATIIGRHTYELGKAFLKGRKSQTRP